MWKVKQAEPKAPKHAAPYHVEVYCHICGSEGWAVIPAFLPSLVAALLHGVRECDNGARWRVVAAGNNVLYTAN